MTTSEPPPKTSQILKREIDPQEWSGFPKWMYISYTAKDLSQENIQGIEIHLVKQNNCGQKPKFPVLEEAKYEEKLPIWPTPRRVSLTSKL